MKYRIVSVSLSSNQRDVRIFDYKENENGNKVAILNVKETAIAQQKQETIKQAFVDWVKAFEIANYFIENEIKNC